MGTTASATNPFPGLRPFEASETHLFFGRDGQASEIVSKLEQRRFVAVVGTSGSGKSSLVRAGLLPMLEGGYMASAGSSWRFAVMRPGADPIGNLAAVLADPAVLGSDRTPPELRKPLVEAVLRRSALGLADAYQQAQLEPGDNLLIVVDQFEELFRFSRIAHAGGSDDEGSAFVNLLIEAARWQARPIYVVLTMRSDFLGDCARFSELPETLNDGQYLVPRLTRDQRRATIEGPIAVCGASIAPRLTQRLLNDAGDDPDLLPVQQHALMRTWEAWHVAGGPPGPIDLVHYEAIGGMSQALSQHADEAYETLATWTDLPGAQTLAQRLFRALCERGTDYRETRRPTRLAELCTLACTDIDAITRVIDNFRCGGRTFVTPGWPTPLGPDTVIDISHESLIRQWGRLREWVQREARSAALYQRLRQTAQLWPENAALWRNPDLERALAWEREEAPNPAWAQRYGTQQEYVRAMEFLRASESAWHAETERIAQAARLAREQELEMRTQRDREARLQAEVQSLQSRKRFLSAVIVLVPALLAGLGWALYNRNQLAGQVRIASEARAEALRSARIAGEEKVRAEKARDESVRLLERLTNSNRLKSAFLNGDAATIQSISAATAPNPALRFGSARSALGWSAPNGRAVYRFDLFPSPESLRGPLKSATQISYYMNHPSFNVKLLSAGAGSGFRASYDGWGCLSVVYVLVEYAEPSTPPELTYYNQCDALD